jgi:hypothetical protein
MAELAIPQLPQEFEVEARLDSFRQLPRARKASSELGLYGNNPLPKVGIFAK